MKPEDTINIPNWGSWLINSVVHPFVIFATPTFLLSLIIYLVTISFVDGIYDGVRSLAGALLPLILVIFIFIFQSDLIKNLEKFSTIVNFGIALMVGLIVMAIIKIYSQDNSIPLTEIVLSGSFSISSQRATPAAASRSAALAVSLVAISSQISA